MDFFSRLSLAPGFLLDMGGLAADGRWEEGEVKGVFPSLSPSERCLSPEGSPSTWYFLAYGERPH